jgi:hypothetical protein
MSAPALCVMKVLTFRSHRNGSWSKTSTVRETTAGPEGIATLFEK